MVIDYDVLVVGAGFAGSTVARTLHDRGLRVLVVDRRPHIAGNAFDEHNEKGVLTHRYGPHIFNTSSELAVRWLSRFTKWRWYEHRVLADVGGELIPVPVNRTTLERFYDVALTGDADTQALLDRVRVPYPRPANVEEAVLDQVGPELYAALFEQYTRKQWGRPPTELDASVVGRLPVRTDRDDRYFTSAFQAMPLDGYTAMFDRILDGVSVVVNVEFADLPAVFRFDRVVWTGPIDEAFAFEFGRLPWRSLTFESVHYEMPDLDGLVQPVGVINYPDARRWTRSTEYRHLTGQRCHWSTVHVETPSANGDPYYPVPSPDARATLARYERRAASRPEWTFVGRLATYKYLSMHQVVGQALRAAANMP